MDLFPTPFSLGTSSMNVDDILPASVRYDPEAPDKPHVGCHIGGVYYSNKDQTSLKDTNFVTLVYNKVTDEVCVIHQKPEFLGPCFNDGNAPTKDTPTVTDRSALTHAFGSIKRQRMLKEFERHADHREAATHASVISRAMHGQQALNEDGANAAKPADERSRLLPTFHTKAACPQDVFPFNKLIPKRILDMLVSETETLATASAESFHIWAQKGTYQKCVLDRLVKTANMSGSSGSDKLKTGRLKLAQCLAYLSHLLALFRLSNHDVQRKDPLPDTPPNLSKYLLQEFTAMVNRGDCSRFKIRVISPLLRDRLIYHMLVVILHCDNFNTVIDELTVDFRMSADKLRRYFTYLGCRVTKEDVEADDGSSIPRWRAKLTTPVNFPDPGAYKGKRRGFMN